jgi:hypothetical protein
MMRPPKVNPVAREGANRANYNSKSYNSVNTTHQLETLAVSIIAKKHGLTACRCWRVITMSAQPFDEYKVPFAAKESERSILSDLVYEMGVQA